MLGRDMEEFLVEKYDRVCGRGKLDRSQTSGKCLSAS